MPTLPTAPTTLPNPPDPANRATFNALAYPWAAALPNYGVQLTAIGAVTYQNALESASSASAASASAAAALAQAQAAAASAQQAGLAAGAVAWISGQSYTGTNVVVYSPIDLTSYRHKAGTSSLTVDPSQDPANWAPAALSSPPVPLGGCILLNNRNLPGNTYSSGGFTYLKTGVLALKLAYPNYPSTYNLSTAAGYTTRNSKTLTGSLGHKRMATDGTRVVMCDSVANAAYSTDGVTWATAAPSCYDGVTQGAGLFVMYGQNNASVSVVSTSPTGQTWTNRATPVSAPWLLSDYANATFIGVSSTPTATDTMVSADGLTWTAGGATPAHTGAWGMPMRLGSNWVLVDSNGTVAYSSNNGATWALGSGGTANPVAGVPVNNGSVIAYCSSAGNHIYRYTSDGITWQNGTLPATGQAHNFLPPVNGIMYARTAGGVLYASTNNGSSWTAIGVPGGTTQNIFRIGITYYCVVSTSVYYTSTDGVTWSAGSPQDAVAAPAISAYAWGAVNLVFNSKWLALSSASGSWPLYVIDYTTQYTGEATAAAGITGYTTYVRAS